METRSMRRRWQGRWGAGWSLGPAGAGAGRGGLIVPRVVGQRPHPVAEFDALPALFAGGFDRMAFGAQ
jgi:hypothetical protein